MRGLAWIVPLLVLAGCASPEAAPAPTPPGEPTAPPAAASPEPPPEPVKTPLGIVFDETHDFTVGGERRVNITAGPEARTIHFTVNTSGPDPEGRFSSAVVHLYYPGSTSPFVAFLAAQEKTDSTIDRDATGPSSGVWRVVFDGKGPTTAHVKVELR